MFPHSRFFVVLLILFCCLTAFTQAQSTVPRIFYSDLQSGPATGGQGSRGAFVTLYGEGFGATRGSSTITVGSAPAYSYPVWSDTKISFQISSNAVLGNTSIVVTVAGVASNAVPFTIRAGHIYFVSPSGSDSQKGTYNRPLRTLSKAVAKMAAGDITYAMGNLVEGATATGAASLTINRAGGAALPFAIVEYPGANATIGSVTGPTYGVQVPTGGYNNWVLAGLTIRGASGAVNLSGATDWRLVANDISCPNGTGSGGCLRASSASRLAILGNRVHDSGSTTSTNAKDYESVDISTSNNVEVGWNNILNTRSCRALNFASTGASMFGIEVHDNYIQNAVCDGISLSGVDASQGAVRLYNNVIEHVGTGPAPGGVEASYACINAAGSGVGVLEIHHNTLSDCGARANYDSGAILASTPVSFVNNVVAVSAGEDYVAPSTSTTWLNGSNNLFYGAGAVPAPFSDSLNTDPRFVDAANHNFRLQPSSPAIDSGIVCDVKKDMDGAPRPQGASDDLGAFEFSGTATTALLAFSQPSLTFGTVTVGTSNTQSITLTNTGTVSTTVTQFNVTGSAFSVSGLTLPVTLAAGQSVSLAVTFAPDATGTLSGSVAPFTSTPSTVTPLQLSGTGASATGSLTLSSASLNFGNITTGTSASQDVTVTANSAAVTISQASITGAGFAVASPALPLTLAAGQSTTFAVSFAPTSAGVVSGTLTISSDAATPTTTVAISGTGVSPIGTLTASTAALSFGSVTTGSSISLPVTFTAAGASVTISGATVSGAGFSFTGITLPTTLSAGQSVTITVKFAPSVAGTVAGTLSVASNASVTPSVVNLSGTGTVPITHSVTVSWIASTSSGVVGYYVYRGTQSGGPYSKTASMVTGTSYSDSSVTAGATYYYVVTAVDGTGTESTYSSEAVATIPTP